MTSARTINLECPCCSHKFESDALTSTNNLGGRSTDFQDHPVGFPVLPYLIHSCPSCGFTGYENEYAQTLAQTLRQTIREKLTPLLKEKPLPEQQYESAAWIAEWSGKSSSIIADRFLRAAWCASDWENQEKEFYYRRQAIGYFKKALKNNEITEDQVPVITYLIGELYRRIEEKTQADPWFDQAMELVKPTSKNSWVNGLAWKQKNDPKEFMHSTGVLGPLNYGIK